MRTDTQLEIFSTVVMLALVSSQCTPKSHARDLTVRLGPSIDPGIRQAPAGQAWYGPRRIVTSAPLAGIARLPLGAPPNGCEGADGGGFLIVSGQDAGSCIGGINEVDQ